MTYREMLSRIARRLPHVHRNDVHDVIDVMLELWRAELLSEDGEIHLHRFGVLYVDNHLMTASGVVRQHLEARLGADTPVQIERHTIRFRPSQRLRTALSAKDSNNHEHE